MKGDTLYFVSFIDDFSRKNWIHTLKHKSEVFATFKKWKSLVEKETGRHVRRLRSDNDSDTSNEFKKYGKDEEIARYYTTPGDPQSNSVAERMNQTLLEKASCLCISANLPKKFWVEALSIVVYLINRSSSTSSSAKLQNRYGLVNPLIILYFIYSVVLHIVIRRIINLT